MAIFFFLIGLELKRELIEGELSDKRNIILPGIGAVGAMAVPALIYSYFNISDPTAMKGWAIPAATDIAFALGVLSFFAFANAGISFSGVGTEQIFHNVSLGIALGLFLGKQVGVFGLCWLAIKLKLTNLPKGMSWSSLYGTAALCGIGFTMSLFIGSLAFEETGVNILFDERLGIILGSLASGFVGYLVLRVSLRSNNQHHQDAPKSGTPVI